MTSIYWGRQCHWHLCIVFPVFLIALQGFEDEDTGAQGGKMICLRTEPLCQSSDKNDLSNTTATHRMS